MKNPIPNLAFLYACFCLLLQLGIVVGVIWFAVHFIAKFW